MIVTGADLSDLFPGVQGRHGLAVGGKVSGKAESAVIQFGAHVVRGCADRHDLPAVQVSPGRLRRLVQIRAILIIQAAGTGIDGISGLGQADDVVQREIDIFQMIQRGEFLDVLVRVLVPPEVERTVVHQNGAALISAGKLLYVLYVNGPVDELVGHAEDVRVFFRIETAVLSQSVVSPSVHLSVFVDGDDMVDAGSHIFDLRVFDFLRNVADVDASRSDLRGAPDIYVALIGQADAEASVAVDQFDVVLQLRRNREHGHGRRNVVLRDFVIRVIILGHEIGAYEDYQEHGDQHAQGDNRQFPFEEAADDHLQRADDLLYVDLLPLLLQIIGQLLAASSEKPSEPAAYRGEKTFFLHFSASYSLTRIRGSTNP